MTHNILCRANLTSKNDLQMEHIKNKITTKIMQEINSKKQFAVCVKNDGYPASLELRKIYEVLQDSQTADHKQIRVVDESGEDYLYPADYFVLIEIPQAVESTFSHAT